jgi:hypothetical protein
LLITDAERELLYEQLKRHAVAGRIGIEELERRVAAIAAAETREEALAALADLPPLPGQAQPRTWGRRHGEASKVGADWRATNERFRDPTSGKIMRVWVDPAGGRHYVVDAETTEG